MGAAVGYVVGVGHAARSACKKAFLGAAQVVEVDDRDRHDCSPASQAAQAWHAVAPGLENCRHQIKSREVRRVRWQLKSNTWPAGQEVHIVAPVLAA